MVAHGELAGGGGWVGCHGDGLPQPKFFWPYIGAIGAVVVVAVAYRSFNFYALVNCC